MKQVEILPDRLFEVAEGQSILDAALGSGITIPHGCRNGQCGACKCKVIKGEARALGLELGLSVEEREEDWVLSCTRTPVGELTIDVPDVLDVELPAARTFPCKVADIRMATSDIMILRLRLPPSASLIFLPGQYVQLTAKQVTRSYSIAAAAIEEGTLELHIKNVAGGEMSSYLFNKAQVGDLLRLRGPFGTFFLRQSKKKKLVFLATGTGIAPVKSILAQLYTGAIGKDFDSVTVFWGVRHEEDFYLSGTDLLGVSQFVPVLSRPSEHWNGTSGYAQDEFLRQESDLDACAVYACGNPEMIEYTSRALSERNFDMKHFFSDAFVSS